jgi:hypothetical protein
MNRQPVGRDIVLEVVRDFHLISPATEMPSLSTARSDRVLAEREIAPEEAQEAAGGGSAEPPPGSSRFSLFGGGRAGVGNRL